MTQKEMLFFAKGRVEILESQFLEISKHKLEKEREYFELPDDKQEEIEAMANQIEWLEEALAVINEDMEFYTSFLETYGQQIISQNSIH